MRIALLGHGGLAPIADLAAALRAAGHEAIVVDASSRATRAADALLARRGFAVPLAHVPLAARAVARGGFDVAHAFTPADVAAALLAGRPVVFTPAEPPDRPGLADARLRLLLWEVVMSGAGALTAGDDESLDALARWLPRDAQVIDPSDAAGYERVYSSLLS